MIALIIGRGSGVGQVVASGSGQKAFEAPYAAFFPPPNRLPAVASRLREAAATGIHRKSSCALSGNDPMRRCFPTGSKYAKFDETQNRCSGHAPWMVNIQEVRRLPPWKPRRE